MDVFKPLTLLSLLFLYSGLNQAANPPPTLKVGYPHAIPWSYSPSLNANPDKPGILIEVYRDLLPQSVASYHLEYLPTKRLYRNLDDGKLDMAIVGGKQNLKDNKKIDCSEVIGTTAVALYAQKGYPFPPNDTDPVLPKTVYASTSLDLDMIRSMLPYIVNLESAQPELLYNLMNSGRGEWVVDLRMRMDHILANEKTTQFSSTDLSKTDFHLCINTEYPNAAELAKRLGQQIRDYHTLEKGKQLYQSYGASPSATVTP